jgi:DNA-binding MarR family transcriptional regulator
MKNSSPEREAFVALLRASVRLNADVDTLLAEHGLTEPQFNALRIVRGAGPKGLPVRQIADRLITRQPDVTRLVDRLDEAGLVTRRRCEDDRRVVYVLLTPKARTLLAKLDGPVDALHRVQFAGLTKGELRELTGVLGKVCPGSE